MKLEQILENGIKQLKLKLAKPTQQKLIDYVLLIDKWNKTYNLTSIRNPEEIVVNHILDSLAIIPYINGSRILDVGSGAGLPGIPLALALPKKHFVLLDSNSKKIRFLNFAVLTLKIFNIEVVHKRVEEYHAGQKFNTIITRAFSSLHDMIVKTNHLYSTNGCLLAMKGKYPEQELKAIKRPAKIYKLEVPNLFKERHLVCIKK